MYRDKAIKTFYNPKQVLQQDSKSSISKSPIKAELLLEYLKSKDLIHHFDLEQGFEPFTQQDFTIAHTQNYVEAFFKGRRPLCESNSLKWSKQFVKSICYTNASLYQAIKHSINNSQQVAFSPTSGFHHATPDRGIAFCTFSGQVIASIKMYQQYKLSGAYLDLDAHYGNSINDSYYFVKDLDKAIPYGCNINPISKGKQYMTDLKHRLKILGKKIESNEVHYVVFAHGADSTKDDDMKGQLTTDEWLECSQIVYTWVKRMDEKLQRPLPLTLCLFGGYRKDDFESVLSLHAADLITCLNVLSGFNICLI